MVGRCLKMQRAGAGKRAAQRTMEVRAALSRLVLSRVDGCEQWLNDWSQAGTYAGGVVLEPVKQAKYRSERAANGLTLEPLPPGKRIEKAAPLSC